jgi:hypothetical protein
MDLGGVIAGIYSSWQKKNKVEGEYDVSTLLFFCEF